MSKQLWRPTTESDGIPFEVLVALVNALNEWREEHLPRVGVPSDFESEWDFVSAVSACKYQFQDPSIFNTLSPFLIYLEFLSS